jgi:hypothetical protein
MTDPKGKFHVNWVKVLRKNVRIDSAQVPDRTLLKVSKFSDLKWNQNPLEAFFPVISHGKVAQTSSGQPLTHVALVNTGSFPLK